MAKDSIWNDNLVNQLKDLYLNKEMTTVNIAKELGFTKNAIIGKIHRLQLNSLKESKPSKDEIKVDFKKEASKPTKSFKEKTIVTFNKEEVKKVVDIAKKSRTVINDIDIPFIIDENTIEDNINKDDILNSSIFQISPEIQSNINPNFIKNNGSHASGERGKYKLSEIEFNMCVWPFGEDKFTFCGDKTVPGKSYCQAHLDLVYFVTKKAPKKKYAELGEGVDIEEEEDEEIEIIE